LQGGGADASRRSTEEGAGSKSCFHGKDEEEVELLVDRVGLVGGDSVGFTGAGDGETGVAGGCQLMAHKVRGGEKRFYHF
jgi:hypothetical protein